MPVKLKDSYTPDSIPVYEMKDGQIGVIVECVRSYYVGTIVQKFNTSIITIGGTSLDVWLNVSKNINDAVRVRILKRGELIEIQDN